MLKLQIYAQAQAYESPCCHIANARKSIQSIKLGSQSTENCMRQGVLRPSGAQPRLKVSEPRLKISTSSSIKRKCVSSPHHTFPFHGTSLRAYAVICSRNMLQHCLSTHLSTLPSTILSSRQSGLSMQKVRGGHSDGLIDTAAIEHWHNTNNSNNVQMRSATLKSSSRTRVTAEPHTCAQFCACPTSTNPRHCEYQWLLVQATSCDAQLKQLAPLHLKLSM
jgi:hypothetical protein